MCGIVGYIGKNQSENTLKIMTDTMEHRGPDGDGFYSNGDVHMAMRRLSVIDLGGGWQPIFNADKTTVIVFNGEIYNHQELRKELKSQGCVFQTQSDTEVIVHLYDKYGEECVRFLNGMFAFCIYDKKQDKVLLARDRMGIKPLYYTVTSSGTFVFASEIKSILNHPEVPARPNFSGIDGFLTLRYSPGPQTMFQDIHKIPEGSITTVQNGHHKTNSYWSWEKDKNNHGCVTDQDYQEKFNTLFEQSVNRRMISDVPLGAFLSGGVDSTAIVAAMQKQSPSPVKTFTVGFNWEGDELEDAKFTANHLGCDHHEIICTEQDLELLPKLIWALDEPVGDPIIMPMFLLSQLARKHVTVALSGEGADELQAGYFMHKTLLRAHKIPKFMYRLSKPFVSMTPVGLLDMAFDYPGKMGARSKRKLVDFLDVMSKGDLSDQYHALISLFDDRDKNNLYQNDLQSVTDAYRKGHNVDLSEWNTLMSKMLRLQKEHWLPDDILTKLDKMTMINSLEGRVPFMDHELVSFLLSVPDHLKRNGRQNKVLLRNYLEQQIPGISNRPKKAFYVPLEKYLHSGPLKKMMDECLSETSVRRRGLFDVQAVEQIKNLVSSGDFLYAKQAFSLMTLEIWFRIFIDKEKGWL